MVRNEVTRNSNSETAKIRNALLFIGVLTILSLSINLSCPSQESTQWIIEAVQNVSESSSSETNVSRMDASKKVEERLLRRYNVKRLACSYRERLYAMSRNSSISFEDLLEFHRRIENMSIQPGDELKDPYSWKRFDSITGIKWNNNVFALRHEDSPKVQKNFLMCLPPKSGTSNWQIALAKLFITKEEMAAKGIVVDESEKNNYFPAALYAMVPRFHTVDHAALLEAKYNKYVNTRDPFTRARSGWRDKMQIYPEDPARNTSYKIYDSYAKRAEKEKGPAAPPKFKVSLEKFLRLIVSQLDDARMNVHWRSQDGNCHLCAIDFAYIIQGYRSEEEWPWVLEKQNLTGILELSPRYGGPDPDGSEWFDHEAKGFVEIPLDLLKKVYRRFFFDFVAGGYTPEFVKTFLEAVQNAQNSLR